MGPLDHTVTSLLPVIQTLFICLHRRLNSIPHPNEAVDRLRPEMRGRRATERHSHVRQWEDFTPDDINCQLAWRCIRALGHKRCCIAIGGNENRTAEFEAATGKRHDRGIRNCNEVSVRVPAGSRRIVVSRSWI